MDWSNRKFATEEQEPTRVIVELINPADENISSYLANNMFEIDKGSLDAEKTLYFLKIMVMLVMVIGLIISVLSFYILMLSIYLLVQKNSTKMKNLMLMGYTPKQVGQPYQLLTIALNLLVLLIAWVVLWMVRSYYMDMIETVFPDIDGGSMKPAIFVGLILFIFVSLLNYLVILRKMRRIWNAKKNDE